LGGSDTKQDFLDDGESSEKIISLEPLLQNGSNLYGTLHWWQGIASEQNRFQNSKKIRLLRYGFGWEVV